MVLDPGGFTLSVNGRDVPVTYLEVILLTELMRRPYEIVRYDRLLALVRGAPNRRPTDTSPTAFRRDVGRLRAKLRSLGKPCIRTMQRVGYGFVPPAERLASRPS